MKIVKTHVNGPHSTTLISEKRSVICDKIDLLCSFVRLRKKSDMVRVTDYNIRKRLVNPPLTQP